MGNDYDVLVVGYGPVGGALAALLGRYGIRVLVIDKAPNIYEGPRAIALDNEALRILQMVGLREDDFPRVTIPRIVFRSPQSGEFLRIHTDRTVDGHPMLVTFHQPELELALRRHVAQWPTVATRTGVELLDFEETGEGVLATLRTADGEQTHVRARYLVGADGASSRVRAGLGELFAGQTYAEDWLIVDALGVPNNIDHVEFLCDPQRPTPHMVAPGGRTRWEFMLRPGETAAQMEDDATVSELLEPWASPGEYEIERKAVYRFHARVCSRFSKGRVFLAGDAAHITPPFVGQGLVAGLRDAANLAWKLAWVVQGRAAASILGSYDEERRPHAIKMVALARIAGLLVMPRSRPRARLSHGVVKRLRQVPTVRPYLENLGVKPTNAYSKGLFVPGRSRVPRGSWFPQGIATASSGDCVLSDELLGPGLVLLCTETVAPPELSRETAGAWEALGGTVRVLAATSPPATEGAEPTLENLMPANWCVVLRPDRTVLHDGPLPDADRLLRESIALLASGAPVRSDVVGAARRVLSTIAGGGFRAWANREERACRFAGRRSAAAHSGTLAASRRAFSGADSRDG